MKLRKSSPNLYPRMADLGSALGVITLTSQPPEGLARNNISLRTNKVTRTAIGNRNDRNRQPRIKQKWMTTDRHELGSQLSTRPGQAVKPCRDS